jgi:NADH-quinone oxidoreductase subunit E
MSVRRLAETQPESFKFTAENARWAKDQIKKYPEGKQASAVIPLLWRAQKQNDGWVSEPAIRHVADMLDMAYIRVYEIATFYTMFNLKPVGKHYVQLCGTTPCWLRGADDLKAVCRKRIGAQGEVTGDGEFSWIEVECLGACVNAPMVQINDDYYEDLTAESFEKLLDDLQAGRPVTPGPQTSRQTSAPSNGFTSLTDPKLYNGKSASGKAASGKSVKTRKNPAPARATATPGDLHADDLTKIKGIGPKIVGVLGSLGIYRFDQIAKWTQTNIEWVEDHLKFKGRVAREQWIEQAKRLVEQSGTGGE